MEEARNDAYAPPLRLPDPRHPVKRLLAGPLLRAAERLFGLEELNCICRLLPSRGDLPGVLDEAFRHLGLSYDLAPGGLARIPASGPLVVVANHPYGAAEGLVLARLLLAARPDVKLLGNYLLGAIPQLRDLFFFVDPFGAKDSAAANVRPLREALRWLKGGGALGVFPAGEVSHVRLGRRGVVDSRWSRTVGRLVRSTEASVLPVHFSGHNGPLFQLAGLIHPRFRTALLPRALLRRQNVPVRIGSALPWERLRELPSDEALTDYLRLRTELLAEGCASSAPGRAAPAAPALRPLAPSAPRERLSGELQRLSSRHLLAESGAFAVYRARAAQIPAGLEEIGRLREATFRAVGEGTGAAADLDRFDEYYTHLFVWDRQKETLVGAYRLGRTDEILEQRGLEGLYTATLFHYQPSLFERVGPALELGRSFVREEYQRSFQPLMLLWKGIGRYVAQLPRYRVLFGAVSISQEYTAASREVITRYLLKRTYRDDLASLVQSRTPLRTAKRDRRDGSWDRHLPAELEQLSRWVCDMEGAQKGVPVLLRQYLKLGGRMLGFNVDPKFRNALDCLVLVDLADTPARILERYLGPEPAAAFLAFHGLSAVATQAAA